MHGSSAKKMKAAKTTEAPVWLAWLLVLAYYICACLMHLRFSLWLVRKRETPWGTLAYADAMPEVATACFLGLLLWIAMQLRKNARSGTIAGYWLAWFFAAVLVDRYLTFSINEYFHYPQYGILAWLVARAMDPQRCHWCVGRVLFWTTFMGIGDEVLQYLWITISYSEYVDFNDFIVNLVAAAAGVFLYYGSAPPARAFTRQRKPVLEYFVISAFVLAVLTGLSAGYIVARPEEKIPPGGITQLATGEWRLYLQRGPNFYGAWQDGPRHGRYFVMPPIPGTLILVATGMVFAGFGRVGAKKSPQASEGLGDEARV
jgi:hypothetical protein